MITQFKYSQEETATSFCKKMSAAIGEGLQQYLDPSRVLVAMAPDVAGRLHLLMNAQGKPAFSQMKSGTILGLPYEVSEAVPMGRVMLRWPVY